MTEQTDRLVTDYLAQVDRASAGLPPARRTELVGDLRGHIEVERSELPAEKAAQVRSILERLGEPEIIAAEAGSDVRDAPVGKVPAGRTAALN
jgi:uncharacterized membrane protein